MNRRAFILCAAAVPLALAGFPVAAGVRPQAIVHTDPSCGCCGNWIAHLREAGFPVEVRETGMIDRVKVRLGVPDDLASCHTAEIDGYVVEGHVPADAIDRLLSERPQAIGLSVPGMPVGSPGMEVPGFEPEEFEVVLFGGAGHETFAKYLGHRRLS
jgi:hypothetical protein